MAKNKKLKVAILGGGLIGADLLVKIIRSPWLECTGFLSRSINSARMAKAISLGIPVSDRGIRTIEDDPDMYDLVFDATSASGHLVHAPILKRLGKMVIDLTPAKLGRMCVPAVNIDECLHSHNVNMITCGGQATIPLAYVIAKVYDFDIDYIEVVSTISSRSAGPATRSNIDEYIDTTEEGLLHFSKAKKAKAILVLNPAEPCINMQNTICAIVKSPKINDLKIQVSKMVNVLKSYVPGYEVVVAPTIEDNRIIIITRVKGLGDFLPSFAGNLDIINCAAVAMAEKYAIKWQTIH